MLRTFLFTLTCLLVLAGSAQAQETTPQPEQNYIQSWTNEVIFPQAVRFSIILNRPASELASLVLAIRPQGRSPVGVEVDLKSAVVSEPYSEFAYIWAIPGSAPPRLFQDIRVEWQATARDGEKARVEDQFAFTDQRVKWARLQESPISLTIPAGNAESPENVVGLLRRDLQPVYDLLAKNTGHADSFNLIVYADLLPGCEWSRLNEPIATGPVSDTVVACDLSLADKIFAASNLIVVRSQSSGFNAIESALIETLVRRFYNWQKAPDWFTAGVAAFYGISPRSADLPRLIAAARNDRLFSMGDMNHMPEGADQALWLAQSYGMVLYIARQIGVQGLFDLARDARTAESFNTVLESALRQPLASLLPNWEQWIFTSQAASAFNITPYQDATATPAPTNTATPTPTPTATNTVPPTATPTPLGFLPTMTPVPTLRPSRTPTLPPPTVTPRPPDSLFTPTPAPAMPLAVIIDSPAGILGVVAIVLIVIAILVLLFTGFRRR